MKGSYIGSRGYVIPKSSLSDEDTVTIKTELTVAPYTPEGYGTKPEPFKNYLESNTKLYLPKYYALQKFGLPENIKLSDGQDINVRFKGKLRPIQEDAIKSVLDCCRDPMKMGALLCLQCGGGKCLGYDTDIIMYDGTIKKVQDIKVGDVIMGDDSTPRNILSLARGREMMYEIIQKDGSYKVNESHILSLQDINGNIIDISVKDYLHLLKYNHITYRDLFGYKVPLDFESQKVEMDPYNMGYWLGKESKKTENIPHEYKCNSRDVRLKLFAGLMDSMGIYTSHGFEFYIQNQKKVSQSNDFQNDFQNDFVFLVRSLGFECSIRYNLIVTVFPGKGFEDIPTKKYNLKYNLEKYNLEKYNLQNNTNYKNSNTNNPVNNLCSTIEIKQLKVDDYYGFEIDGNHRFVLGDFTVTHNTVCGISMICTLAKKTIIIAHKEFLLEQWKERIQEFAPMARVGLIKAQTLDYKDKDIVLASLQSISMKNYNDDIFNEFGCMVLDECHHLAPQVFSRALRKITCKYSIGLTATPKRKDGLTKVFKWYIGDIAYESKKVRDTVEVRFHRYYNPSPDYSRVHILYNKKPNISRMINSICEFMPRVEFLTKIILDILKEEPKRRFLVLSDRRQHVELIKASLDKYNLDSGFYYGGMKQEDMKKSENCQLIIGTFQNVSEGFDCKGLDTLVLGSPKGDVIQICGRILRDKPEDRKHTPLIIDIFDDFATFPNQAKKRHTYYKKCKYEIIDKDNMFVEKKKLELPKNTCLIQD